MTGNEIPEGWDRNFWTLFTFCRPFSDARICSAFDCCCCFSAANNPYDISTKQNWLKLPKTDEYLAENVSYEIKKKKKEGIHWNLKRHYQKLAVDGAGQFQLVTSVMLPLATCRYAVLAFSVTLERPLLSRIASFADECHLHPKHQ